MFAFKDFVIVCSIAGIVFGSAVPVSTIEKRDLQPYTSAFLGDARQPGVLSVDRDDRNLAHKDGKHRRLVKIKLWCGDEGPISMIPWYNDHNGEDGIATHQTWGADPPHGKFHEMNIDYNNEHISIIDYASCGKPGSQKICHLYLSKINTATGIVSGFMECEFNPALRKSHAVSSYPLDCCANTGTR